MEYNYFTLAVCSLLTNIVLLLCLLSPNIVRTLHSSHLKWKDMNKNKDKDKDQEYLDKWMAIGQSRQ